MTTNKQLEESNNSTEIEVYKPTPHMEKWLDTAMQLETETITEIAEASGIDKSTWYNWLKQEGFIEWFNAEWDRRLRGHAWKLDAIGMKNAKRDYNYWKSMQQRAGRLIESKGPNVQVNNFIPILGGESAKEGK